MIAVVDTGGANIASVMNALRRLERAATLTRDPETIHRASHVILPGVGAALDAMNRIRERGLLDCLTSLTQPTLGICLGMQLLFEGSTEGPTRCLGILPGLVTRLSPPGNLPVPHMGWNALEPVSGPLFRGLEEKHYYYFVHSFAAPSGHWVTANFEYGGHFPAAVAQDNYFGVQFHPERSSTAGQTVLRNFLCL